MPPATKPAEKKESREEKRLRKEREKKAEELTRKYVVPGVLIFLAVIFVFFVYRFGFGGAKQVTLPKEDGL